MIVRSGSFRRWSVLFWEKGKEVKEMAKRILVVLMAALVIVAMVASSAAAAKPQFCYTSGNPFVVQPQCYDTMRDCLNHQNNDPAVISRCQAAR